MKTYTFDTLDVFARVAIRHEYFALESETLEEHREQDAIVNAMLSLMTHERQSETVQLMWFLVAIGSVCHLAMRGLSA